MVGSLGAYVSVVDFHRMLANAGIEVKVFRNKEGTYKAAGMPGAPISDEHEAEFTRQAQRSFDLFRADVLRPVRTFPMKRCRDRSSMGIRPSAMAWSMPWEIRITPRRWPAGWRPLTELTFHTRTKR